MGSDFGFVFPYGKLLGAGLVRTLLTGSAGEGMVATVAASLMDHVTRGDSSRGGRVLVGSPEVVRVEGSIAESYLEVIREMRVAPQKGTGSISRDPALRGRCWSQAAVSLAKGRKRPAASGRELAPDERRELENRAALELLEKSTTSFVEGRARVRHERLRREASPAALQRALEERGLACAWNRRAGSALLTWDSRRMSRQDYLWAVLPLARWLQNLAA